MRMMVALLIGLLAVCPVAAASEPAVLFDFTQGTHDWRAAHHVENMQVTPDGLVFDCTGADPYIVSGPVANLPLGDRVLLTIRMRSEADPVGEVFFGRAFTAGDAVRFTVKADGQWHDYDVLLPAQAEGTRLRIDPAAGEGRVAIAWIKAVAVKPLAADELAGPGPIQLGESPPAVQAGGLSVVHGAMQWDGFTVQVDGQEMARAHGRPQLGIVVDGEPVYLDLSQANVRVHAEADGSILAVASLRDAGGANWRLQREFRPMGDGAVRVRTEVVVDQDRAIFHLPMLTLFAGLGTFGESKTQAVLPGVEYLEDEPSSSEADVRGAKADRRVVESQKLCLPMMSVVAGGRYVGLVWSRGDRPAAVFDSPDRVFRSGGHLMGLWFPGVGDYRLENELHAFRPFPITANTPLPFSATLMGGLGETVEPAVRQYVRLAG
ncbi:MAG: hypothetical protein U1E05_10990, partial [Patescibacteria group bacterium]|nr:hypothetical protein [Patescibacteria group bacterium]